MSSSIPQAIDRDRPAAYRSLVRIAMGLGILTFAGGLLWLVGGAGIYGSPVAGAFHVDPLTGHPDYWQFWMIWVVVAGPITLLPCALTEWHFPRVGASAMFMAAGIVAEAGIRASRVAWGFSDDDALIVIGCIATPMVLLALSLLILGAGRARWRFLGVVSLIVLVSVVGVSLRYTALRSQWNALCVERGQR